VAGRVMACDRDSIHNPLSRGQETRKCAIYCATRLHAYTTSKVATCPHGLFGSYAISLASTCLFFLAVVFSPPQLPLRRVYYVCTV
jgi:hypothetical protein